MQRHLLPASLIAATLPFTGAFYVPTLPVQHQVATPATKYANLLMMAKATSKDELLLEEEIERSGVSDVIEDRDAVQVDTSVLDAIDWSPSARGEPGKTPRDLK